MILWLVILFRCVQIQNEPNVRKSKIQSFFFFSSFNKSVKSMIFYVTGYNHDFDPGVEQYLYWRTNIERESLKNKNYFHVPAMKNVRSKVAGIQRVTNQLPNSKSCISTNWSKTSGPKDLSMPGSRKLANAHPATTYHPQSPSGGAEIRCPPWWDGSSSSSSSKRTAGQ